MFKTSNTMVDIVEGNKLIAEFMGIRFNNGNAYDSNGNTYMRFRSWNNDMARNEFFRLNKLYHNSWDWLMPVVETIESLGYEFIITESRSKIKHNTDHSIDIVCMRDAIESKQQSVYLTVVEFIQWYNENK